MNAVGAMVRQELRRSSSRSTRSATADAFPNVRYVVVPGNHMTMVFGEGARSTVRILARYERVHRASEAQNEEGCAGNRCRARNRSRDRAQAGERRRARRRERSRRRVQANETVERDSIARAATAVAVHGSVVESGFAERFVKTALDRVRWTRHHRQQRRVHLGQRHSEDDRRTVPGGDGRARHRAVPNPARRSRADSPVRQGGGGSRDAKFSKGREHFVGLRTRRKCGAGQLRRGAKRRSSA